MTRCFESASYASKKLGWTVIECCENNKIRSITDISNDIFDVLKPVYCK